MEGLGEKAPCQQPKVVPVSVGLALVQCPLGAWGVSGTSAGPAPPPGSGVPRDNSTSAPKPCLCDPDPWRAVSLAN